MVLEGYFYVGAFLFSLCGFNILLLGLFLVWMPVASFLSICWMLFPLIGGVTGVVVTRACTGY